MMTQLRNRLHIAQKSAWLEQHFKFVLVTSALIAAFISLMIGMQQSVWFDEAYSIMVAKQPLTQLIHLTAMDTHPPFYYLLLKFWAHLFGWSELALRSLSVLALAGSVVFGGLFIKRTFSTRTALITLPFVAFAPFLLRYGFEIRMYALASLIGIAATYVLVCALQAKQTRHQWLLFAVYGVLVALGMYTLYYMALLWIAHVVWLVWVTLRQKQPIFKSRWLLAFAVSVVLFLPWLPTFLSQVNNGALASISQPLTIDNLAGIVSFTFLYQPAWQLNAAMSLLVLAVIILLTYASIRAFKIVTKPQHPYLVLLALYVIVPVTVLALISIAKPMYTERYIAHVIIGGSLFIGVAIALLLHKKPSLRAWLLAVVVFLIMLLGVAQLAHVGNYNFQRLQTPTIKLASSAISECDASSAVLAADPYVAIELSYYLPQCQIRFYSETVSLGGGYAPLSNSPLHVTKSLHELASNKTIYYAYYGESQLQMPVGFTLLRHQVFGALTVDLFSAE